MSVKKDFCKTVINHYGTEHQKMKAVEELTELSLAIMHFNDGKSNIENVKEEIADVLIMIEQIKEMNNISDSDIQCIIDIKQNRTLDKIANDNTVRS